MMFLTLEANRSCYSPNQIDKTSTMTVGELISYLSDYDEETPVIFSSDNGYTYGELHSYEIREEYSEGEELEEDKEEDLDIWGDDEEDDSPVEEEEGIDIIGDVELTEEPVKELEEEDYAEPVEEEAPVEEEPMQGNFVKILNPGYVECGMARSYRNFIRVEVNENGEADFRGVVSPTKTGHCKASGETFDMPYTKLCEGWTEELVKRVESDWKLGNPVDVNFYKSLPVTEVEPHWI